MPYVFDLDTLAQRARDLGPAFREARPYPHVVIDDFLRAEPARELARVFPGPGDPVAWDHYAAPGLEVKLGCSDEEHMPRPLRQAIHDLNSRPFVQFLEALTGIEHLLPDPHLAGGGIHLSRQGGHLGVHADFNWHERLQAHRRLNLLIFLNEVAGLPSMPRKLWKPFVLLLSSSQLVVAAGDTKAPDAQKAADTRYAADKKTAV